MVTDTIETYLNLDEPKSPIVCNETGDKFESIVSDVQSRHNQIQERFVALKTITETLKGQIQMEKELWTKELKETVAIERGLWEKTGYESGDKFTVMDQDEYKQKYEIFKEFVFFTNATRNLEKIVSQNNYQQTLHDVESKCNMELLKIQHSMTMLKPLKEIASKWNIKEETVKPNQNDNILENTAAVTEDNKTTEDKDIKETNSSESINTAEIKEILQDINEIISTADEMGNTENELS